MSKWWGMWFVYRCLTNWERDGLRCLPFLDIGCPVPDIGNVYLVWNDLCVGHCFCSYSLSWNVYVHGLSLRKNGLDKLPRILRCLGLWVNHLLPVWWSTFRYRFLVVSWYGRLIWWRWILLFFSCLYSCFMEFPILHYYFSSHFNLPSNSFFILGTLCWHFP